MLACSARGLRRATVDCKNRRIRDTEIYTCVHRMRITVWTTWYVIREKFEDCLLDRNTIAFCSRRFFASFNCYLCCIKTRAKGKDISRSMNDDSVGVNKKFYNFIIANIGEQIHHREYRIQLITLIKFLDSIRRIYLNNSPFTLPPCYKFIFI